MASSKAATVADYLAELPPDRRPAIAAAREFVRRHLPAGYREAMAWGMISWEVPLERYPDTYNGKPLVFAALAAQKAHNALYLMCSYMDPAAAEALRGAAARMGIPLDMGKSCLRFRTLAQLPQREIGALIASMPVPSGRPMSLINRSNSAALAASTASATLAAARTS